MLHKPTHTHIYIYWMLQKPTHTHTYTYNGYYIRNVKKGQRKNEAREKGRGRDEGDINGICKLQRNGQK